MKTIHIDDETAHRLRIFIASRYSGKVHGKISITTSKAINMYIDSIEDEDNRITQRALGGE